MGFRITLSAIHRIRIVPVAFVTLFLASCAAQSNSAKRTERSDGYSKQLKRGQEILSKLSSLSPKQIERFDGTTYRDEIVGFVGFGAIPGATNDLQTEDGYYLRVINPEQKDLRPQSVAWKVQIRAKILQVLPAHKIILIEVQERDWFVIETL